MTIRKIAKYRKVSGYMERSDNPKISIRFEKDDFAKILAASNEENVSFADVVRRMCRYALDNQV